MEHTPFGSKKLITATYLFRKVLRDHLNNKIHQCPFISNDKNGNIFMDLLNHIKIKAIPIKENVNEPINTLNIMIDTRQTSKLYLAHLSTYHSTKKQQSTDCLCLFWKHYLNKFNYNNIDNMDEKELKQPEQDINKKQREISTSKYLINCKFLMQIICNSPVFVDKLYVKQITFNQWKIQINQALIYHNIDLKGSKFIFFDEVYKYDTNKKAVSTDSETQVTQQSGSTIYKSDNSKTDLLVIDLPTYPLQSVNINAELLNFNDLKSSLHSIDYKLFFQNKNTKSKDSHYSNIINNINDCIMKRLESCDSNGTGMVYCSDYDEDEVDSVYNYNSPYGCDYMGDGFRKIPHFKVGLKRNLVCNGNDKSLTNHASTPIFSIKNKEKQGNNLNDYETRVKSVKSAVTYDSNKYYIPCKGYGLQFKSQSNVTMNSELPCAGKMGTHCTDESVFCFDD